MIFINLGTYALGGRWGTTSCSLKMESDIIWMSRYSDLPSLKSIISRGCSFSNPYSVILSSMILNSWIWIDIPNLQTAFLLESFSCVQSRSVKSTLMNLNEWIDVSPILANLLDVRDSDSEIDIYTHSKEDMDDILNMLQSDDSDETEDTEQDDTDEKDDTEQDDTEQDDTDEKEDTDEKDDNDQTEQADQAKLADLIAELALL